MATGPYELEVRQSDIIKLQRMGWHFSECKRCGRQLMSRKHKGLCELCTSPKRTVIDFIKLLFKH